MEYHFLAIYQDKFPAVLSQSNFANQDNNVNRAADPYLGANKWPNEQVLGVTYPGKSPLMMHPIYA